MTIVSRPLEQAIALTLASGWLTTYILQERSWPVSRRHISAFLRQRICRPLRTGPCDGGRPAQRLKACVKDFRPLVAQEPGDLPHCEVRLAYILKRERTPQLVDEFGEIRPFLRQSARECPRTDAHRPRYGRHVRPAVGQKAVDFVFDRGAQRACSRMADLRRLLAIRTKSFEQVSIGGDERQIERIFIEIQRVGRGSELTRQL